MSVIKNGEVPSIGLILQIDLWACSAMGTLPVIFGITIYIQNTLKNLVKIIWLRAQDCNPQVWTLALRCEPLTSGLCISQCKKGHPGILEAVLTCCKEKAE